MFDKSAHGNAIGSMRPSLCGRHNAMAPYGALVTTTVTAGARGVVTGAAEAEAVASG